MLRKILNLLPFLLLSLTINSQTHDVNIMGYLTWDGVGVSNTDVRVFTPEDAQPFDYDQILTTNSDGVFSDVLTLSDSITFGILAAELIDCTGDTLRTLGFWQGIDSVTVLFDIAYCDTTGGNDCYSWIHTDYQPSGGATLTAEGFGFAPLTYLWSTGETGQVINVLDTGDYCVTVTDDLACSSTSCMTYFGFPVDTLCYGYIYQGIDSLTGDLTLNVYATNFNQVPITGNYAWTGPENFTASTAAIIPIEEGNYCVTVSDSICSATACYYYQVFPPDTTCYAYIYQEPDSNGGYNLLSYGFTGWQIPFGETYQWTGPNNFAATTQNISVVDEGDYCVTITDSLCSVTTCYFFTIPANCGVDIYEDWHGPFFGPNTLSAYGWGAEPITYLWSNGQTDQTITPNADGEYCVTATDALGCMADACYNFVQDTTNFDSCIVWIEALCLIDGTYSLTANSWGNPPYTYLWSTGETTQTISAVDDGIYCVDVTDANGCVASECFELTIHSGGDTCLVYIDQDINSPIGSGDLTAVPYGSGNFTYLWNTGETTETITPDTTGEYCVTVTNADSCVASACAYVFGIDTSGICDLLILQYDTADFAYLIALPFTQFGLPFDNITWSTGDTSFFIMVQDSGTYCATLSTASCNVTTCYEYSPNSGPIMISGNVGGNNASNANMVSSLYQVNNPSDVSYLRNSELHNLALFGNNTYLFEDLSAGEYLVRTLDYNSANSVVPMIPTYNGNVIFWDEATPIAVTGNHQVDINMIPGKNLQGPGFIGGFVEEGTGGIVMNGSRGVDFPLSDVSMILLDQFGEPVVNDPTDVSGRFSFDDLPYGRYEIHINQPGVDREIVIVNLTPNNPTADNIIYSVDGSSVTTGIEDLIDIAELTVYPNPFKEFVSLELSMKESADVQMTITNLNGKTMIQRELRLTQGGHIENVDLSDLASGVYFMNIIHENEIISKKLIKQ